MSQFLQGGVAAPALQRSNSHHQMTAQLQRSNSTPIEQRQLIAMICGKGIPAISADLISQISVLFNVLDTTKSGALDDNDFAQFCRGNARLSIRQPCDMIQGAMAGSISAEKSAKHVKMFLFPARSFHADAYHCSRTAISLLLSPGS